MEKQITTRAHAKRENGSVTAYYLERTTPGSNVRLIRNDSLGGFLMGTFTPDELLILVTPEEIEKWKEPLPCFGKAE